MILVIVAIIIIIVMLPTILSLVNGKDEELADDSILIPQQVSVSAEENAHPILLNISIEDTSNSENLKKLNAWTEFKNSPEINWVIVSKLLKDYKQQIESYTQASGKKRYQSPITANPQTFRYDSDNLEGLNVIRTAGRLTAIQAIFYAENGNIEEALDNVLKIYAVGHLIQNSQGSTISNLVGISQTNLALNTFQYLQNNYKVSESNKNYVKKYIGERRTHSNGLKSAIQFEYLVQKQIMEEFKTGEILRKDDLTSEYAISEEAKVYKKLRTKAYYFKPNASLNESILVYTNQLKYIDDPCSYVYNETPVPTGFTAYITENIIGKLLNSTVLSVNSSVFRRTCEQQNLINETLKL